MNLSPFLAVTGGGSSRLLTMSPVDLLIIIIYFLVVLAIGFYLKKFASTGEDFFMAGRKMTAWVAGLSFISANLSSLETMGWSAMAYQYGMLGAHAYLIGAIPAILFLAVVMMPFYYICRTHSVPGYLKLRYGEASRSLAGISFSFMTVLVCGVNMFAMATVLRLILGWNMHFSIWVSSVTVAIYVSLGGLLSAVFNEVLQFFLIWLGTLLVPILGLYEAGGWTKMIATINAAHPGQNFTSLWANMGSANNNPMGMHWTGMVFGLGLAVSFGYWCTDFLQVQRVMAAKSLRSAQNGTIIGAVLKMCVPLIVTLPGLLGLAILTQKAGITLMPEYQAQATGGHSYNQVLPLLMARYLGPGLLGLGVSAMIAGFMSGMAGNVSAFATVWTYDVYRPLINKKASDAHYVSMGRWCSIIGVLIAIVTAYGAMLFSNILAYLQVLVLLFIVPLFATVILGMLWKQATPAGGFWGFLIGILASFFMFFYVHWFPGYYLPFMEKDIRDLPALAQKIQMAKEPVSQFVVAQMPPDTRKLLDQYVVSEKAGSGPVSLWGRIEEAIKEPNPEVLALRSGIVNAMNAAETNTLYSAERFSAVSLTPEQLALARQKLDGDDLARFNRSLLEKAYPGELARMRRLEATQLNPVHAEQIATSPKAQDMAVNMFSAFWSLLITLGAVIMISLFTEPKPDSEIKDLVYGMAPLPNEGTCAWYAKPTLWAAVVGVILVVVNIIFW
ncbi:MAG: sodium/solute symporter [Candidatus Omnitrophica bacterium]|nr:sodium/solute symporter [Candidatus Omnitrophota bacterium]